MKAVIIDDMEQARATLRRDLCDYLPEVEVVGEAGGVIEGAKLLRKAQADLVFLDIEMQDGSGFDLLDILAENPFKIIFVTASDAHAIKAFRYAAVDYLLKPVDPELLQEAVKKIGKSKLDERKKYELLNESRKNKNKPQERLALHSSDKILVVNLSDIVRCESHTNYTIFFMTDGKEHVVTRALKEYESILSEVGFFRVHHSHLVNIRFVREFVRLEGGHLVMLDGKIIPVSVRKKAEFIKMLDEL